MTIKEGVLDGVTDAVVITRFHGVYYLPQTWKLFKYPDLACIRLLSPQFPVIHGFPSVIRWVGSRGVQNLASRARLGQDLFWEISRIGSDRIGSDRIGSDRIGSGEEVFKSHGWGSGHPKADLIQPVRSSACCCRLLECPPISNILNCLITPFIPLPRSNKKITKWRVGVRWDNVVDKIVKGLGGDEEDALDCL